MALGCLAVGEAVGLLANAWGSTAGRGAVGTAALAMTALCTHELHIRFHTATRTQLVGGVLGTAALALLAVVGVAGAIQGAPAKTSVPSGDGLAASEVPDAMIERRTRSKSSKRARRQSRFNGGHVEEEELTESYETETVEFIAKCPPLEKSGGIKAPGNPPIARLAGKAPATESDELTETSDVAGDPAAAPVPGGAPTAEPESPSSEQVDPPPGTGGSEAPAEESGGQEAPEEESGGQEAPDEDGGGQEAPAAEAEPAP